MRTILILLLTTLLTFNAACSVPRHAPDTAKSNLQIAEEAVDCMLERDPNNALGIMFMGGKDSYAVILEQTHTRNQIIALRNQECRSTNRPTGN